MLLYRLVQYLSQDLPEPFWADSRTTVKRFRKLLFNFSEYICKLSLCVDDVNDISEQVKMQSFVTILNIRHFIYLNKFFNFIFIFKCSFVLKFQHVPVFIYCFLI
jgi:hypothetical protein